MSEHVIGAHNAICTASRARCQASSQGARPTRSSRCTTSSGWSSRSRTWSRPRRLPTAFGFATALRTDDELHLRGSDAGAPCVLIRRGQREKFLGPAFVAAEQSDLVRLADATGTTVRPLPETLGGVTVDLVDPSGLPVRVVSGTHQLEALPTAQTPHVFNFGHEKVRTNATAAPAAGAHQRAAARTHRGADPEVHRGAELVPRHVRHDRQRLLLLPRPARARADLELHPLRPRLRPRRSPHPGHGAGSGQALYAFGLRGRRPRRAGRRRRIPARARVFPLVGHRPPHRRQPDLRLLA